MGKISGADGSSNRIHLLEGHTTQPRLAAKVATAAASALNSLSASFVELESSNNQSYMELKINPISIPKVNDGAADALGESQGAGKVQLSKDKRIKKRRRLPKIPSKENRTSAISTNHGHDKEAGISMASGAASTATTMYYLAGRLFKYHTFL